VITVNVTWLSWLMAIAVAYYALLLAVMAVRRAAAAVHGAGHTSAQ